MYSTSKSKSKSRRWGDWSDWIWNEDYQRYYRSRQDASGNVDYEWHEGSTSAETDEATPRESAIDDLTDGVANLQTPSASAVYDTQTPEYTVASGGSRSKSKTKSSSRSKGKQRSYGDHDDDLAREEVAGPSRHQQPALEEQQAYYDPQTGEYYTYADQRRPSDASAAASAAAAAAYARPDDYSRTRTSHRSHDDSRDSRYSHDESRSRRYSHEDDDPDEDNPDLQAAIAASRDYNSYRSTGEPSNSAYEPYEYDDQGPPTPRAGPSSDAHIAATGGIAEQLDPRYRVEHSGKFQPGEIFKVLWSEPQGTGNDGAPSLSDRREFRDRFGGKFFVGFRRFIVIANDLGHCTCVPILTYGGKGCKKRGVKPEKHGIIYERGHKARLLSNEPKLGFPPARVDIYMEGEKLSKESRVNYSKLVTVEHNVKVFFIGQVTASDWDIVSDAVNRCWEEKIHHKRKQFK